jgi:23S rRNA G2445 N2-methylase RlmL
VPETYFATCAPGLEPVLHAEARALKLGRIERQVGGVRFEGTRPDAWRANLWLRSAGRVLWRVARFPAPDAEALYAAAREVPWERWLAPEGTLHVDAQLSASALNHTRFVEQRVKDAVVDRFVAARGARPSVAGEEAELRVHVHLFRDRATLALDTSGAALYKRGWRAAQGRAPLAETLAAGLVLASGWDRRAPLLDPFCGSGTILVEAALLAANAAPGLFRARFGCERWLDHDARAFAEVKDAARAARVRPRAPLLYGWDLDAARLADADANARAAGVEEHLALERGDATRFAPRPGWNAWIVTNPPYGERVGRGANLEALYRGFGARLREHCAGYRLQLLSTPALLPALGIAGETRALANGPLECASLACEL